MFLRLAARADVVIENFRPGVMDGYGLGYAGVCAVRPDIVYVSISGFGQFGPDTDRAGYDPLAQATSGFLSLNGDPSGEPVKAPTFLADDLGGLHAALAALAALLAAGLPIAPVRSYAEAAANPHVRAREMLQDVAQQDGTLRPITGPAAKLSRTPLRVRSGAPALGAHNDEILREAGFDPTAIAELRKLGVV